MVAGRGSWVGTSLERENARDPEAGQVLQRSRVVRAHLCDTVTVIGEGEPSAQPEPFLQTLDVSLYIS